jgi:hypothetical protein
MCTPLKLTRFSNVHFFFPHIIVLDVNLMKIVLTSFFLSKSFCICRTSESGIFL